MQPGSLTGITGVSTTAPFHLHHPSTKKSPWCTASLSEMLVSG